jgi:hypothetical protein
MLVLYLLLQPSLSLRLLLNIENNMLTPETLHTLKIIGTGIAVATQSGKILRIVNYNRRSDEVIDLKLLLPYSSIEIDGSYDARRKKVMRFANSMMVLFYLSILLLLLCFAYPSIAASLNLV